MVIVDYVLIIVYLLLIFYLGLFTVKPAQTIREYAVGSKNFSTYSLVATIFATWVGSFALLNTLQNGFNIGISYFLIVLGDVFNLIICAFLAKYFCENFNNAISIGDIIEPRFGLGARVISGVISFMVCVCYVTAQFKALNLLFEYFFHIPYSLSVVVSTCIILCYSTLGGVNAVIKTDKLQSIVILIFVVLLLNNIAPQSLANLAPEKLVMRLDREFFNQYFYLFISFLIPLLPPHAVQRMLLAKDSEQGKVAFVASGFLASIFYLICIILGIWAFSMQSDLDQSKILVYLLENNLKAGFLGVGFIGVISILISTVDSFMNIAAVSLTKDVLRPMLRDNLSEKMEVRLVRGSNIFMSILTCILSIAFDEILEIMFYALNLWGPIMTVPMYCAIFNVKVPKATFYVSLFSSLLILIMWESEYEGVEELFAFVPATFWSSVIFFNALVVTKLTENRGIKRQH